MKTILPLPKKVSEVKPAVFTPPENLNPPSDLTSQELLDAINQADFEVPTNVKDLVQQAIRTVKLSARQPYIERKQGTMFLAFFFPSLVDPVVNKVSWDAQVNDGSIYPGSGQMLWLILPSGKRMSVDFTVQSEKEDNYFHVGMQHGEFRNEYIIETTGSGQHLIFNVDARQSGFYGFDILNRARKGKLGGNLKNWTFYKCTIVELD